MHNEDDFERRLFAVNWSVYERVGFGSIPKTIVGLLGAKPAERSMWQDRLEFCLLPQASLAEVYKSESTSAMGAEIREWLEIGSAPTDPSGA